MRSLLLVPVQLPVSVAATVETVAIILSYNSESGQTEVVPTPSLPSAVGNALARRLLGLPLPPTGSPLAAAIQNLLTNPVTV